MSAAVTHTLLLALLCLSPCVRASVACYDDESGFAKAEWAHCQKLKEDLFMYYEADLDMHTVKLGLHAASHAGGWSSLAFAGNGGMKGASQIVVRKIGNEWVAEDRFSEDYSPPRLDTQQDVQLLFASEQSGGTSWGVVLKMDSCDEEDYPIEDHSRWMHWALGSSHSFNYHGRLRGQFHANLFQAPSSMPSSDGLDEYQLKMPNVKVELGQGGTDASNPYICAIFDLAKVMPDRDTRQKHHVAQFQPYLNKGSEKYVHHMILLGCNGNSVKQVGYKHGDVISECESMPKGCYEMKWPWAVGAEPVVFPDNVGMPIGEGQAFMALQMHYYNPNLDKDVFDSSGVRLLLTKAPRAEDAGLMQLNGGTSKHQRDNLPFGESDLTIAPLVVPPTCTKSWTQDLNILGVVHHGHLLGKTFKIDVIRDSKNLGMLRRENRYDFNHQSLEEPSVKVLKPSDELRYSCTYDTSRAQKSVEFGDLTQQEMCWSAVMYYPKQRTDDFSHVKGDNKVDEYAEHVCTTSSKNTLSTCEDVYLNKMNELLEAHFSVKVEHTFGALYICNTEHSAHFPSMCPSCHKDNACTAEDVQSFGKSFCKEEFCSKRGLPLWPATSSWKTTTRGMTRCAGREVSYTAEQRPSPICQVKGGLSNTTRVPYTMIQQKPNVDEEQVASSCSARKATLALAFFAFVPSFA